MGDVFVDSFVELLPVDVDGGVVFVATLFFCKEAFVGAAAVELAADSVSLFWVVFGCREEGCWEWVMADGAFRGVFIEGEGVWVNIGERREVRG